MIRHRAWPDNRTDQPLVTRYLFISLPLYFPTFFCPDHLTPSSSTPLVPPLNILPPALCDRVCSSLESSNVLPGSNPLQSRRRAAPCGSWQWVSRLDPGPCAVSGQPWERPGKDACSSGFSTAPCAPLGWRRIAFDGLMEPVTSLGVAGLGAIWALPPATVALCSFVGVQASFCHIS